MIVRALVAMVALLAALPALAASEGGGPSTSELIWQAVNLAILAIVWCVAIPILIYISDRIHATSRFPAGYRGFARL